MTTAAPRPIAAAASPPVDPILLAKAERDLAPLMQRAEAAKQMIDAEADKTAARFGGKVSKAPVKSLGRAAEKVVRDYKGDASRIKDLARNTVVVAPEKTQAAIDDLVSRLEIKPEQIKTTAAATDPLGYSGTILNVRQPDGMMAEMQVNSPEMIYAKESEEIAERALGAELFNAVKRAIKHPGGLGHTYYEEWRALGPESPEARQIAEDSRAYYDAIRAAAKTIDWAELLK